MEQEQPMTKRERRLANKARREEEARKAARARKVKLWMQVTGGIFVVILVISVGVWAVVRYEQNKPGKTFASQGNDHVGRQEIERFDYNSVPPTSGPHASSIAGWGVFDRELLEGRRIHNLEDGGVGIHYDCETGTSECDKLVESLTEVVRDYPDAHVFLAPYPNMGNRIALTAWQKLDKFDTFDETRVREFIEAYEGIDHHVGG